MLKDIAQHGSGMYYFIENSSNIPEAFADCLGGLLSVCAQNITLRVEAAENVKINKITTKFPLKTVEDRKVFEVQIGDLQSEEQVLKFYRIFEIESSCRETYWVLWNLMNAQKRIHFNFAK
jgi:hypothetical protein